MLIRVPDYLTYVSLSRENSAAYSWQRNVFPVTILIEEIPVSLIEPCQGWIQRNQGVLEVMRSKTGDASQRDLLVMAPFKAFLERCEGFEVLSSILSEARGILERIKKKEITLTCAGKDVKVGKRPCIMGILNVTPDSFSDGGAHFKIENAIERAHQMVEDGADIIDVGGESSRPGSDPVDTREELVRVIPVVSRLAKELNVPVSIDTTKHEVARAALDAGAGMINDISGLHWDLKLADMAAKYKVPVIIMHTRGKPKTMQQAIHYHSLFSEIIRYLREGIEIALAAGVPEDQIVVDPGIGFGKTPDDNLRIMNGLYEFSVLGRPVLLGTSRKSFIGKVLDADTNKRLEGTLATTIYGLLRGADIIRVHDLKENARTIRMLEQMMNTPEIVQSQNE